MRFQITYLALMLMFYSQVTFSETREGKAVYEISSEKGMRLTDIALKNIEVKVSKVTSADIIIPVAALVYYQDQTGIYRLRDGWFKLVPIQITKKMNHDVQLQGDFQVGDSLVIQGADLLRVSEMDAFGSGE